MAYNLRFDVKKRGLLSRQDMQTVLRQALRGVVTHWHTQFIPRHFEPGADRRYGYRRRSEPYRKRKARMAQQGRVEKAGMVDLVFTGALEAAAEGAAQVRVSTSQVKAKAKIQVPVYARFHAKLFEIGRLTAGEEAELARVADRTAQKAIDQITKTKAEHTRVA